MKLEDIWNNLDLEEKGAIMKDLVALEKKMLSVSLNRAVLTGTRICIC